MLYIYIAGPMRGLPEFNFPAFFAAEQFVLTKYEDATVFNPARRDVDAGFNPNTDGKDFDIRGALADDLNFITRKANLLIVLQGWENSRGARAEVATAAALDIPVQTLEGNPVAIRVERA